MISVDTKKKELIGRFKNAGAAWSQEPVLVKDHDFRSEADGKAIPYGIYDVGANLGTVVVGTTNETAQFAIDAIELWWLDEGRVRYPQASEILILADGGGANGASNRVWKHGLHHQLALPQGLTITVAHYPPGAAKWNPIEHRLFSEISKNWAGRPLDTFETALNHIRTTTTKTGLRVTAHLIDRHYDLGVKISDAEMQNLAVNETRRASTVELHGCAPARARFQDSPASGDAEPKPRRTAPRPTVPTPGTSVRDGSFTDMKMGSYFCADP